MNDTKINNTFGGMGGDSRGNANIILGLVLGYVSEENDNITKLSNTIDNSNFFVVQMIDVNSSENVVTIPFANASHGMDFPVIGEAVLCVKTPLGVFIVDRFSPYGYGINYDPAVILTSMMTYENRPLISLQIDSPFFKKEPISENKPFKIKPYSSVKLGRNNQYLIFDHGYNLNSSTQERKLLENGSTIKLGFRNEGATSESTTDNCIVVTHDLSVVDYFKSKIKNGFIKDITNFSTDSVGIQTDDIVLVGRKNIIIYGIGDYFVHALNIFMESENDMTIKSNNDMFLMANKFILSGRTPETEYSVESEKSINVKSKNKIKLNGKSVELGTNPNNPAVLGNELVAVIKELSSILTALTTTGNLVTPQGTVVVNPSVTKKIVNFKTSFTNRNSKYLSKEVKLK